MFEDSTFESTGRIQTRSRGWMIAMFLLNGSILLGLILIPLISPEALPKQVMSFLLTVPPPPVTPPPPPKEPQRTFHGSPEMVGTHLFAPPALPTTIWHGEGSEEGAQSTLLSLDSGGTPDAATGVFSGRRPIAVVHPEVVGPMRLPSSLVAGLALYKAAPAYPAIARAAGVQGTVVLQAMISEEGTIENLRVVSGPVMLQQAALDAVKTWRYRPYLLNSMPVEVETTVNVVFTMGR